MFRVILWNQWRESRVALLLLGTLAFAAPVLSMRQTTSPADRWAAWELLDASMRWSATYPIIALLAALVLAAGAWRPDHRTRHVYALSLPLARPTYLLLRFGAGLVLLLGIGIALLGGAAVASLRVSLPPLLHAYPVGMALRFVLAGLTAYTLLFALNGLTGRAARILVAALLLLVILSLGADLLALDWNPMEAAVDALLGPYSPLAIFRGRWMLIDV